MHLYSTNPANFFTNIGPGNGEITGPTKIDKKINIQQMQGKAKRKEGPPYEAKTCPFIYRNLLNRL